MANNFGNSINSNIGAANSGATNTLTVTNPSNTASSQALVNVTVGGTSAGDPFTTYTVSGTTNWSEGIDNSVTGDPYVLASSTALGTTNVMVATTAGSVTKPLQPACFGYLNATDTNATGNGAVYTLGSTGTALTIFFDQQSNLTTAGVFTAPVTGKYLVGAQIVYSSLTAAMTYQTVNLVCTGNVIPLNYINVGAVRTVATSADLYSLSGCDLVAMTAGDTFTVNCNVAGGAGNTASINGTGSRRVNMWATLVC